MNYATQNNITFASVQNAAGNFVKASPETVAAAGENALKQMKPGALAVDIWNQKGENAYLIAAFTHHRLQGSEQPRQHAGGPGPRRLHRLGRRHTPSRSA